jgi:hypothetical protein
MAEADSSSEEFYDETNWVLYKYRVDWKDVTPVPQDDGPYPIVAIAYSEKCEYTDTQCIKYKQMTGGRIRTGSPTIWILWKLRNVDCCKHFEKTGNCHFPASGWKCMTHRQELHCFPDTSQVSLHENNKIS